MKIFRFRAPPNAVRDSCRSYGYIRANFFERIFIRGRIAGGDTGLYEFEGWEPGPRKYRARFAISAKDVQRRTAKSHWDIARKKRSQQKRLSLFNIFR